MWTVLLMWLLIFLLLLWFICCCLGRLNNLFSYLLLMLFNRLLAAARIWWSTMFKLIKIKFLLNSIHIFFISFLSLRFSECLFSSSVFMTNNKIFVLSLCVAFFIEIFTFANAGIKHSFLKVLKYFMSAITFLYLVCSFSNDLITVITSCPCFFLIRLKMSFCA